MSQDKENPFETRRIDANFIKQLAKRMNIGVKDVLALSENVDPFYADGGPAKIKKAKWITQVWKDMGSPKIHGRALNYWMMGRAYLPHNGKLYDGSKSAYAYCVQALGLARYLGMIPYDKIPDHKTTFHQNFYNWEHNDIDELASFTLDYEWIENKILDHFKRIWYPYQLQDTVAEVWIEKSSVVSSLKSTMRSYQANYIEGEGDISLTRCWEFTERVVEYYMCLGIKRFRVFYISDFDPVGLSMPISMARKVEYLIYRTLYEKNIPPNLIDIRVEDIAVTPEQVDEFKLKTTKVPKEKITRKDGTKSSYAVRVKKFSRIYGVTGVVELEALSQTVPTELGRIVKDRLSKCYDKEIDYWIDEQMERVRAIIKTTLNNVDWNDLPKLGKLRIDWSPLVEYVGSVTPPEARHNEFHDWGIFWLLESKLDYAKQLKRYTQFRLNMKEEYFKERYPEGQRPLPSIKEEGKSMTDEDFKDYLEYVARKQHELRENESDEP